MCVCERERVFGLSLTFGALLALFLALLTGASAGTLPDRPKAVRDASKSSRASTMAKSAALAQSHIVTNARALAPST